MVDLYLVISQSWEEQSFQSYQILKTSKHEGIERKMHGNKNVIVNSREMKSSCLEWGPGISILKATQVFLMFRKG